jgi:hypothetical protein
VEKAAMVGCIAHRLIVGIVAVRALNSVSKLAEESSLNESSRTAAVSGNLIRAVGIYSASWQQQAKERRREFNGRLVFDNDQIRISRYTSFGLQAICGSIS